MTPRNTPTIVDSWLTGIATAARLSAAATQAYADAIQRILDAQPDTDNDEPESTLVTLPTDGDRVAIVEHADVEDGKQLERAIVTDTVCDLRGSR